MAITITSCPEHGCGTPAEVIEQLELASTDRDVVMARVIGACGHRFVMPLAWLAVPADPPEPVVAPVRRRFRR